MTVWEAWVSPGPGGIRSILVRMFGVLIHIREQRQCLLSLLSLSLSLPLRDMMNRSDSDSALPLAHGETQGHYSSKPFLLSSRLHPLQGHRSWVGGGGGLEKSSSLGELRGSSAAVLAASCSTRSLCVPSDAVELPLALASSASSSSSGNGQGMGVQLVARRSPTEDRGEDGESTSSRRRNAFNNIFKKKQGRH